VLLSIHQFAKDKGMSISRSFTIVLEPAEEGGFIVSVPALPEVATCGDTEDEALANAREAIELVVEHRLARGEKIPEEEPPRLRKITISIPAAA
jgi:antitoxin HicB